MIADFNARHGAMGHSTYNNRGLYFYDLMRRNKLRFLGPDFATLASGRGKPDLMFSNQHGHFNTQIEPGPLTTSDHIPLIITIATKQIIIHMPEHYQYGKAKWERYMTEVEELTRVNEEEERDIIIEDQNYQFIDQRIYK